MSGGQKIVERKRAAHGFRAQLNQQAKFREGRAHQPAGRAAAKLGNQGLKHCYVVAGLEARREHEGAAADEAQRELEFRAAVGGIDVHQYEPGARRPEHRQYPLGTVRRPDADALARLESTGDHSARHPLNLAIQFGVREVYRLARHHERRTVRYLVDGGLQNSVDRAVEQRLIAGARHVTQAGLPTRATHTEQSVGARCRHGK